MKQLPEAERLQLQTRYADWVMTGSAAGRSWIMSAVAIWGLGAFSAAIWWPSPAVIAGVAVAVIVGVFLFRRGARKERLWRQENPFQG